MQMRRECIRNESDDHYIFYEKEVRGCTAHTGDEMDNEKNLPIPEIGLMVTKTITCYYPSKV